MSVRALLLALTLTLPALSHAALIHQDLHAGGDNLATYDDHTGRLWIKSSATEGLSYNNVKRLLVSTYDGFRIATRAEVQGILFDYGFFGGNDDDGTNFDMEDTFAFYNALIARTYTDTSQDFNLYGWGYTEAPGYATNTGYPLGRFSVRSSRFDGVPYGMWEAVGDVEGYHLDQPVGGFFLVKEVAHVPLPSSSALFGTSILALMWKCKRLFPAS